MRNCSCEQVHEHLPTYVAPGALSSLRDSFVSNLLEQEVISRMDCNANSDRNTELRNTLTLN